jgi:hypothetical protein
VHRLPCPRFPAQPPLRCATAHVQRTHPCATAHAKPRVMRYAPRVFSFSGECPT